ncbi:hypothetical protein [Streptomyces sp. NPDC057428]|uniref:hypothetical protein n=1 Tax=Streptomyces sp. NPDC057428 TaxID=3346129 RepID=UPI0036CF4A0B
MPSSESADRETNGSNGHEIGGPQDRSPDRGPSDVFLDVPALHVDELDLEVDDLEAHVSLQAEVLDLLKLNVGADVRLGHVKLDIEGVDVQAQLRVRLHNIAVIVTRLLTTVDRNPQVLEQLTRDLGTAVEDIASGTGRAVGELGEGAGTAVSDVGRGAGSAAEAVGEGAGTAVEGADAGEVIRGGVEAVGDSAVNAGAEDAVGVARTETEPHGEGEEHAPTRSPHRAPERRRSKSSGAGHAGGADKPRSGTKTKDRTAPARRTSPAKKTAARKASSAKPAARKAGSAAARSGGKATGRARRRT